MNQICKIVIVSVIIVMAGCSSQIVMENKKTELSDKPNILFIYTDDQAPWAIGVSGNEQALTPNMDELARLGMYFPNAYTTTPVCSPSRAGLLTSKFGFELGIDDWINSDYERAALSGLEPELGLSQQEVTWPELLQDNGYHTGLIGKWHLGVLPEHHPSYHGYDEFIGFTNGGTKTENPVLELEGKEVSLNGLTVDILTHYAKDFLSRHKTKPFLLSLHYRAPHTRWLPVAPEDEAPYKDMDMLIPVPDYPNLDVKKNKRFMKEYLSSVRSIDRNLGVLMEHLRSLNLLDNTLIVFTSDHGYNMGHNGIWHKGNGHWLLKDKVKSTNKNIPVNQRPNMYDNSIKVPTLVLWKNNIQENSVNQTTLSNLDWFPTLIEAAGISYQQEGHRGNSVLQAFLNPELVISSDYYASYTTRHQSITGMRMYSDGKFKLVKDFINPDRDEFYDLSDDPAESNNLIADEVYQDTIRKFEETIYNKMLETRDPLLKKTPFFQ